MSTMAILLKITNFQLFFKNFLTSTFLYYIEKLKKSVRDVVPRDLKNMRKYRANGANKSTQARKNIVPGKNKGWCTMFKNGEDGLLPPAQEKELYC